MILARVQGHPSRTALQQRLLPLLQPLPTELLLHQSVPPDPWAGYQQCLRDIPDRYTHVVVVQDDAIPAANFAQAVGRIAGRWPDIPVCLFLGAYPAACATRVRRAKPDVRYLPLGPSSFMPLVTVLWPVAAAAEFLAWASTSPRVTRADDANGARWLRATKQQAMVTIPSIVQHDDDAPTVKGGRISIPWTEAWRYALNLAEDAADYDW